jgi:hypothetical protein
VKSQGKRNDENESIVEVSHGTGVPEFTVEMLGRK